MTQTTAYLGSEAHKLENLSYRDEALRWALRNPDAVDDGLGVLLADALDTDEPDDAARAEVLARVALLATPGAVYATHAVMPMHVYLAFLAALLPWHRVGARQVVGRELFMHHGEAKRVEARDAVAQDNRAKRLILEARERDA